MYSVTIHSLLNLVTAFSALTLGILIYVNNRKARTNQAFLSLALAVFGWKFGEFMLLNALNPETAIFWCKNVYLGSIFISISLYNISVSFFKKEKQYKYVYLSYLVGALFFAPLSRTYLFVKDVQKYPWGYWYVSGDLFPAFLAFFSILVTASLLNLYLGHRSISDLAQKRRIGYLFSAILVSTISSVDYLPNYGIPIYPFGFLPALACIAILAYAILRYRLMDIRIAAARISIFVMVYAIVLVVPFGAGLSLRDYLSSKMGINWWFIPVFLMAALATAGPFIYTYLRRKAEDRLLYQQRRYQQALLRASQGMLLIKELDRLLKLMVYMLTKTIGITHACIYLRNTETDDYLLKAKRERLSAMPAVNTVNELSGNSPLIQYLSNNRKPILCEEALSSSTDDINHIAAAEAKRINANVIVPCFVQDTLLGFLAMGKKITGDTFTEADLTVFQVLANQAALAIENALFYEETGKTLAQQFHEHRLRSIGQMGSKMGHQVNNRFQAILAGMEEAHYLSLNKLQNTDLTSEQKALLERIEESMVSVEENAKLGGDIAKRLTTFSRKDTKIKPIDLKELISSVLVLLSCKFNPKDLNLKLDIEDTTKKIRGDMAQLQDVFFNLFDNTHDAQDKRKSRRKDYTPQTSLRASLNADTWHIELSDNGIGMTKETLDQLFLPFFTTKATTEKGTGIGLSIIKAMVGNLNGTIRVESEYGKETTFYITLPATEEEGNA